MTSIFPEVSPLEGGLALVVGIDDEADRVWANRALRLTQVKGMPAPPGPPGTPTPVAVVVLNGAQLSSRKFRIRLSAEP